MVRFPDTLSARTKEAELFCFCRLGVSKVDQFLAYPLQLLLLTLPAIAGVAKQAIASIGMKTPRSLRLTVFMMTLSLLRVYV